MILRLWQGWTRPENAAAYRELLASRVFPEIRAKAGDGLLRLQLLEREEDGETAFITQFWFDSMASIERVAGEDVEAAYVPEEARRLLSRFDRRARHFRLRLDSDDRKPDTP